MTPKRLIELGFGHFVVLSVAFAAGEHAAIVTFRTATRTILEQIEQFLRLPQSLDADRHDAAAMAESFRRYQVETEGESSDEIAIEGAWSSSALVRVTVDLDGATAAGLPIVKARAASLVNAAGEPWTEDRPRDDAQLVWLPTY